LGQLGNGSLTDALTPVQVDGLTNVVAIAAGGFHSLALKGDGTVWAWGYGGYGQIGNSTYSGASALTPVMVDDLSGIGSVAAGEYHTVTAPSGNVAPTASFTHACTDLDCTFTDESTDSDGTIASWSWTFGDGATSVGQNPTHTYGAGGTYTVGLTVTDNDGATDTASQDVTVTAPNPGGIELSLSGYKVKGVNTVDLTWSGTAGSNVDIYRIGAPTSPLITTADNGSYTDSTGEKGGRTYTYQVCEAGTSTCSDLVTIIF